MISLKFSWVLKVTEVLEILILRRRWDEPMYDWINATMTYAYLALGTEATIYNANIMVGDPLE